MKTIEKFKELGCEEMEADIEVTANHARVMELLGWAEDAEFWNRVLAEKVEIYRRKCTENGVSPRF